MALDGLRRDEESRGHLLVGAPRGDELGDPPLGGGQTRCSAPATTDAGELAPCSRRPEGRLDPLENLERVLEGAAGPPPFTPPPARGAQPAHAATPVGGAGNRQLLPASVTRT